MSSSSPSREMPSPYSMSTTQVRKGGATLFLTILIFVRLPTISLPSLMGSLLRMSMRTEA